MMLAVVRAARPTNATAAITVATTAALTRTARGATGGDGMGPLQRNITICNSIYNSSKLGWHDVGGDRGLQGEPLVGIEPGRAEPPLAHWEKRSHALLGLLVARCV